MDKELIDRVWRILPAEFKRIVKARYAGLNAAYKAYLSKDSLTNEECDRCKVIREKISIYSMYFGIHNLTSDAEGEDEMLCVSRKRVQEIYTQNQNEIIRENVSSSDKDCYEAVNEVLKTLFGSKCLPDNVDSSEPNVDSSHDNVDSSRSNVDSLEHLEPKASSDFTPIPKKTVVSKWDKTESNSDGLSEDNCAKSEPNPTEPKESPRQFYRIIGTDEHGRQVVTPIPPQLAGPYDISKERTEPEASTCTETCTDACSSPCKSQDFDNILNDSFSKERRLTIAAMAMQGLLSNPNNNANLSETVADALNCADALLHESEKGTTK